MANSRHASEPTSLSPADSRIYGLVWFGLLAAAVGVVVGLLIVMSEDGSVLAGGAVASLSVAIGVLIYLVSKVLDRL